MKKLLIVGFDLIRAGEPTTTLSVGSIIAHLQSHPQYGDTFNVCHHSVNLLNQTSLKEDLHILYQFAFNEYDAIAISAYVWGDKWMRPFLADLRQKFGYKGVIILGGYQVSYNNDLQLKIDYPEADYFIKGYAEQQLLNLVLSDYQKQLACSSQSTDLGKLDSPYLMKAIKLNPAQSMVRMEAKRGCPYKCSFCAHKDNLNGKVEFLALERTIKEIDMMHSLGVQKINFLDPVFNMSNDYLQIASYFNEVKFKGLVSLQSRPELIAGAKGKEFIKMLSGFNAQLEFGIQTMDETINKTIHRQNNYRQITLAFLACIEAGVAFEVSLIYGLPGQTLKSFENDIAALQRLGVEQITAWPLMLLKGTELYSQRSRFNFKEAELGRFSIPHVISSSSFSESEWRLMHEIATELNPHSRVY